MKQFFRPDKRKIILVVILCLFTIFIEVLSGRAVAGYRGTSFDEIGVRILQGADKVLLLPFYLISQYILAPKAPQSLDLIYAPTLIEMILLFISIILYWYFISCVMVGVYRGFRKKS